jgi:hypothetical protein
MGLGLPTCITASEGVAAESWPVDRAGWARQASRRVKSFKFRMVISISRKYF